MRKITMRDGLNIRWLRSPRAVAPAVTLCLQFGSWPDRKRKKPESDVALSGSGSIAQLLHWRLWQRRKKTGGEPPLARVHSDACSITRQEDTLRLYPIPKHVATA